MFKLTVKLAVLALAVIGICSFLPGNKVYADNQCPSSFSDAVNNDNWGVNTGGHTGDMAGLIIHAYDGSNNQNLQVTYHLNSGITRASSNDPPNHDWGTTPNGTQVDLNDRIFHDYNGLPSGFEDDPTNRTNSYESVTTPNLFGGCDGWDAFGPAIPLSGNYTGNGEVLDCGPTANPSHFWFNQVRPTPIGDTGDNGQNGYWSINIYDQHDGETITIPHYTEGSMNYDNGFTVSNGFTTYVNMIWHPQPSPKTPGGGTGTGTCQDFKADEDEGTGNKTRVWVTVTGAQYGKLAYRSPKDSTSPTWYPGPDGNSQYNPRQDFTSGDGAGQWVGPGGSGGDTGSTSFSKEWWYEPNANSITITYRVDHLPQTWDSGAKAYNYKNSSWNNGDTEYVTADGSSTTTPTSIPCFLANACVNPLTVTGDLPGGHIQSGGAIHVSGTYQNTGLLPLWYPSVVASDGNTYPVDIGGADYLNPGGTGTFSFTMGAPPGGPQYYGVGVTPAYYGAMNTGSCSDTVPVYQYFSAYDSATSTPQPNTEHPTGGDDYLSTVTVQNDASHDVNIPTTSSVYKLTASGVRQPPCASYSSSGSGRTYNSSPGGTTTTVLNGNCSIPPGSYVAGDEYCATITIDYGDGYVGPDDSVVGGENPKTDTDCPRIANEPYFRVLNSGISAGGDFDQCTTNGGLLASYNDNDDPAGADRGASSQLSNLALIKITGVASAQTPGTITRSPTGLTFANANAADISSDSQSPGLGGNFGGCAQLTNETAPSSATDIGSPLTSANRASGAYTYNGNLSITGGTLPAGRTVSMYVNGNVYIEGNIKYQQTSGWSAGKVPLFMVHATGNIYIRPSVNSLAGVYIAQKDGGGNGGKIYTCADSSGFAPMLSKNLYTSCNSQLVVYGSFIADQVNLMRTFGSLRDEQPVAGTPAGTQLGLLWTTAGPPTNPLPSGYNCTHIDEPSDPNTWYDNWLCLPSTDPSGNPQGLKLAWTHYYNNPSPDGNPASGWDTQADIQAKGYPYCTKWDIPAAYAYTWYDNVLCMNQKRSDNTALIHFSSSNDPNQYCTNIHENGPPGDPDRQWNWDQTGFFLCEPKAAAATLGGAPSAPACSNPGARAPGAPASSCAGEIFEFSPELYLSNGGGTAQPASGGALQYQSLTSLPPVL